MVKKMKLKTITEEEIEAMSFDDLAYVILKEKGKKMKISEIFQIICELQNLGESAYESQIADFFTLLATEKRFIQLDKGFWDLRENHTSKIDLDDVEDDEDDLEETEEEIPETTDETDDMFIDETKESDDDEVEDEYKDLVVVDEENEADL